MSKTAIIQRSGCNGFYNTGKTYWSESCDSAAKGFRKMGFELKSYNSQDRDWCSKVKVTKNTPVRGSVQSVRAALRYLGVPEPKNVDIPEELMEFAGRKVWHSTVGKVKKETSKVFVKPLDFQKDFSGHMVRRGESYVFRHLNLPNDYRLLCQEPVDFLDEYRCYVANGRIVGICHNELDEHRKKPLTKKELAIIKAMLEAYKSQPAGFCLDVGRLGVSNKLVIIETNEGFSCGNYGIPHVRFAEMIKARWDELVSQ